ncbi:type II secretion system F family protein [Corynebacterium freiburgense]|uniref:type II secretion system F family protein n=1 Tax=Corynebacterium freiburgense TaxID=556548 RepID=UPI0003F92EE3|nr:type II secretion system F family protein [Corynebacterium freiburgense]WJZ01483.1 Bacterial type II secretion system protein F domain protein [Corynebacterium freiburgense]
MSVLPLVCLAGAIVLHPPKPTTRIIDPIQRSRRRAPPTGITLETAADVDLFAACIRAGLSSAHAASAVARITDTETWHTIASLLAIGVPAERAWAPADGIAGLEELASLARISERSGAAMTTGCNRVAENIRAQVTDKATATAERAGVLIAMPLTMCFLPAFFILGLAPTVISLALTLIP